ncbi:MAG: enoyl-CoA hydratase/isomerase family protein [Candidatus Hodarchaeales archaeon]|jgi:enoyl-CoA hydratase/carnithine racemase
MEYKNYKKLRIRVDKGVAFVTIDNPPINLMDMPLLAEMGRFAAQVFTDDDVRVIVYESADPEFFIAHYDVSLLTAIPKEKPPQKDTLYKNQHIPALRESSKVTIAKIEGIVGGGGSEFVLALDMRFGAIEKARFSQKEAMIGILAGGGGTQLLTRKMGRSRALEAMLGCDDFTAETAEKYGWINRALPANEIGKFVEDLAYRIAMVPPETIKLIKECANAAVDKSLVEGLIVEANLFEIAVRLPESKRRMEFFIKMGGQSRDSELGKSNILEEAFKELLKEEK